MPASPAVAPAVLLVDGDDASGMAIMLADLLEANLREFPGRRRVAAVARGEVVFEAADRGIAVTLTFVPGAVEVRNGSAPGVSVVAAPWLSMAQICSGSVSPWAAWRCGDLTVSGMRHAPAIAAASFALSVPQSFYEAAEGRAAGGQAELARRSWKPFAGVAVTVVVVCVLRRRGRRRRRRARAVSSR